MGIRTYLVGALEVLATLSLYRPKVDACHRADPGPEEREAVRVSPLTTGRFAAGWGLMARVS
jgi:hypothetical protein